MGNLLIRDALVLDGSGAAPVHAGWAAELLLFDPAPVDHGPKRRVHDLPPGAARLTTDAIDVHGVWVNGSRVADAHGPVDDPPLADEPLTEFAA